MRKQLVIGIALLISLSQSAKAQEATWAIGKNGYIFVTGEYKWAASDKNITKSQTDANILASKVIIKLKNLGITPVVVIVPTKARIYSENLPTDTALPKINDEVLEGFKNNLSNLGATVVDPSDIFKMNKNNEFNIDLFFKGDSHWTQYGSEIAAKLVSDSIADLIKQIPTKKFSINYSPVWPVGYYKEMDLVKKLPEKDQELYKNQLDRNFKVSRAEPSVLLDEEEVYIALAGTSYSKSSNQSFYNALSFHTQRDIINYSIAGTGPLPPIISFLKSKSPSSRILIWEIPERYIVTPNGPLMVGIGQEKVLDFLNQIDSQR